MAAFLFAARGGGVQSETATFADGAAPDRWEASGGAYLSPTYPNAVDRIELTYAAADGAAAGTLAVTASGGAAGADETPVAVLGPAASAATFDFPESVDVRRFRLTPAGVAPRSFTAYWRDAVLEAPAVTSAVAWTTTSAVLAWRAVDGATGYTVAAWTNVVTGAADGLAAWTETFAGATRAASSSNIDKSFADMCDHAGWMCEKVYPTGDAGTVRVGNKSSGTGWILSPTLSDVSGDGLAVRVTAGLAEEAASERNLTVSVVSGGVTNRVGEIAVSGGLTAYSRGLAAWPDGGRLLLTSPAAGTDRSVIVARVEILTGWSAGETTRVVLAEADAGEALSYVLEGLPEGVTVNVGVTASGARGATSGAPTGTAVDLAHPLPRANVDALPLSDLTDLSYAQDFGTLEKGAWLNGVTLAGWQAFTFTTTATSAVTELKSSSNATDKGIYLLVTNDVRAVGALATQKNGFAWGVAFTNDLDEAVDLASVAFDAGQWGFNNAAAQTLAFAVCVADGARALTDGEDWQTDDAWTFTTPETGQVKHEPPYTGAASGTIEAAPGVTVPPGGVVLLRWTFDNTKLKTGKSAVLGAGNVRVRFARAAVPLTIRLVRAARR